MEIIKSSHQLHKVLRSFLDLHLRISLETITELSEKWKKQAPSRNNDFPKLSTKGFEFSVSYTLTSNEEEQSQNPG